MKEFSATTEINASPAKIWAILTDGPHYPNWDPGMEKLEGRIGAGEKLSIHARISPGRVFKVTVSEFEPERKMVWSSGMPLGLFKGARTFRLELLGPDRVKFSVNEIFDGLLLPMIGKSLPDMQPVFAAFAAGLKGQAERN